MNLLSANADVMLGACFKKNRGLYSNVRVYARSRLNLIFFYRCIFFFFA